MHDVILTWTKSAFDWDRTYEEMGALAERKGLEHVVHKGRKISDLLTGEFEELRPRVRGLIVRSDEVTSEIIDALPNVENIIRAGSGFNTINTDYATPKGVRVRNTPGTNAPAVKELVFAVEFYWSRFVDLHDALTRKGGFSKKDFKEILTYELYGKSIGIAGLGQIGRLVACAAAGHGMKVYGYDPLINPELIADINIERVATLDELFDKKDMVTLHMPLNGNTRGAITDELIMSMSPQGALHNTSRDGLISANLAVVLSNMSNFRYHQDVYTEDEPVDGPRPLETFGRRVVYTPHIGGSTPESNHRSGIMAMENALRTDMRFVVNEGVLPGDMQPYAELAYKLGVAAKELVFDGQPTKVQAVPYGSLKEYGEIFTGHILRGLLGLKELMPKQAMEQAADSGINVEIKEPEDKGYGDALTLDFYVSNNGEGGDRVSVRGTVHRGHPILERVQNYLFSIDIADQTILVFEYENVPGIVRRLGQACEDLGYNIEDMAIARPHEDPELKMLTHQNHALAAFSITKGEELEYNITDLVEGIRIPNLHRYAVFDFREV